MRYIKTYWLSLQRCCNKDVKKYPALKSMFLSRAEKETIDKGSSSSSETNEGGKFYQLNLNKWRLPMWTFKRSPFVAPHSLFTFIYKLQFIFSERWPPLALRVYPKTKELIRIIASRFFKTSYHGEDIIDEDITDDADNYLPLDEVFICFSTRQKLRHINEKHYNTVSEPAVSFYRESLRYVLDRMNMSCSFWWQAVLTFSNKGSAEWSHVEYFLNTLSNVLPNDDEKIDRLYEEFTD